MVNAYIYKITNTINGKVYVGQHDGSKPHYFGSGEVLKKAVKKYGKEAFSREIVIEGQFSKQELDALETHYIARFECFFPDFPNKGYNLTRGGDGLCGYVCSEATKELHRAKSPMSKPVVKLSLRGTLIAEYRSGKEAGDSLGISSPAIYRACTGENRTAGGFGWMFKKDYSNLKGKVAIRKSKAERPVGMYSLTGELLKVHPTIEQAARAIGCKRNGIGNALIGIRPTSNGYQWRYVDAVPLPRIAGYDPSASLKLKAVARTAAVAMYDLSGLKLDVFASCVAAAAHIGAAVSGVRNCCTGKTKTCRVFVFKYDNDKLLRMTPGVGNS